MSETGGLTCKGCEELIPEGEVFRVYGLACCESCYQEEQGALAEALEGTGFFGECADFAGLAAAATS